MTEFLDDELMQRNLAGFRAGKGQLGLRVSAEHYQWLGEQIITLRAALLMGLQLGESGKHGGGDSCPTCHFVREARAALKAAR